MKKIILAIGLMFGGVAFVNAQQTQQQDTTQTQQSDQYRSDSTSTDDSQNQPQQEPTQADTTSTEQSDMYRTEGEGNTNDSTSTETTTESTEATPTESTQPTTDDQQSTDQNGVTLEDQEKEGEKIEVAELPAAVQTKLQSTDYQGWVVTSARKKMWSDPDNAQSESKEVYVIEAKNGAETKKLKFDKEGNEIEHDKNKKDDQK